MKTRTDFPNADRSPQRQLNAILHFGPYRLDVENEQLWRGTEAVRLTGKAFAVLRQLVLRPNQLVSKSVLFQAVWPETIVSETTLTSCIKELRKALEDDARAPRYIETVHRRGYRWIAQVISGQHSEGSSGEEARGLGLEAGPSSLPLSQASSLQSSVSSIVGRDAELAQLSHWFENALRGERQIGFVTGEPGIGKTTLVESFLQRLASKV